MKDNFSFWVAVVAAVVKTVMVLVIIGVTIFSMLKYLTS